MAIAGTLTALALVLLFYYPVATVFVDAVLVEGTVTLDPLARVLTDPFYVGWVADLVADPVGFVGVVVTDPAAAFAGGLGLVGFTAYQALLSTLASVALGLPGAWVLARFEFPGRRTLRSLTILPFVLPAVMVAVGFVAFFGAGGPLNGLLTALGLPRLGLLYTLPAIVVAHAFYNAPLVTRLTTAAWEGVDARTVETARSLGASPTRAFRDVVLPQLLPAVLVSATLTFVFTFASFPIVLALGGFQFATVEVWVYKLANDLNYAEAAALATVETALSITLTYLYLRFEARQGGGGRGVRPLDRRPLLPADWTPKATATRLAVLGYALVAALVFLGPLVSMVVASVAGAEGVTLRNYAFLLERQQTGASFQVKPFTAVVNSVGFAVGALLLALPMGVAVAAATTRRFRGRKVVDALAMAPFAVSGIVVGLGLLRGLVFGVEVFGVRLSVGGPVAIVAAHAVAAYPFVTRNVAPALGGLDRRLVESARSLGASRTRALLDVELPLVWPGVVAGAAFAVAISVGEFDSTVVLASGAESYTMPVAVERLLGRRLGPATAMGVVLLVVTSLSFVVVERFGERAGEREREGADTDRDGGAFGR
ncbi:ABC transporter permease [Halobium salinum]|uniref:ABC transporter permease n=1 Tax=Halobium salinum TaxID=1364940 RepID=A0ABD5PG03_9EURY|nr:iron ABC transporter permease [Halobium salinum]